MHNNVDIVWDERASVIIIVLYTKATSICTLRIRMEGHLN